MPQEQLLNIYLDNGITAIIVLGVLFFTYKYVMMKLELHKKEVENKLRDKKYVIEGDISIMPDDMNTKVFIKLKAIESEIDEK